MEWVRSKAIGHRSFSTVNLTFQPNRSDGIMAVKSSALSESSWLREERDVMRKLGECPHIIGCIGDASSFENGRELYNVFLEYASGGSLADIMKRTSSGLPEGEVRRLAKSVVKGLKHIHSNGFVHCDIKLDNILLCGEGGGNYKAKISDFGLAMESGNKRGSKYELRGTPMYMAPECLVEGRYEPAADVWALGCAVAELVSGQPVWSRCSGVTELLLRIGIGKEIPEVPSGVSEEGRDFLRRCFVRDPAKRWTAEMLLNHPFVMGDDHDRVVPLYAEKDSTVPISPRCPFDLTNSASSPTSMPSLTPFSSEELRLESFHLSSLRSQADCISQLAGGQKPNCSFSHSWTKVR